MNLRIKDCEIKINFYFFALLCVISFFDKSGMILFGILSALLHESGHLAAMLLIPGQSPSEVCLTPFGIRIKKAPLAEFMGGNLIVLASGSAVNLVLAALLFPFWRDLAALNFVMGIMNLLPVETLDGGGIISLLLRRVCRQYTAEKITTSISLLVLIAMSFMGIYILFRTRYNFTLLGMSLWMLTTMLLRIMREEVGNKTK